jgi:hypothetical protein
MNYLKLIADEKNAFTDKDNKLFYSAIEEGKDLVNKLSAIEDITEENIKNSVLPE